MAQTYKIELDTVKYELVRTGRKSFFAVPAYENLQVGDNLNIREFQNMVYTGNMILAPVIYVELINRVGLALESLIIVGITQRM